RIGVVILSPKAVTLNVRAATAARFACVRVVAQDPDVPASTAAARTLGIRSASAPIVAMTEEHSFPDPDWAEHLLAAYAEGGDRVAAVGAGIVNANPDSGVSWVNFLLEYGPW